MDITDILLRYDPKDAILMMVNLENNTNFRIEDFEVSPPRPGVRKNTQVTIRPKRPAGRNHEIPYHGEIIFEYNRLNVAHHFRGVLEGLDIKPPTSSQVLLNRITAIMGQEFTLDDIVLEDISRRNAALYYLKAKAESWRWYGQMLVRFGQLLDVQEQYDPYLQRDLGHFYHAHLFNTVESQYPFANATAWNQTLQEIAVNTAAQDQPALFDMLNRLLPMQQPKYRPALHDNIWFQDGYAGWDAFIYDNATNQRASATAQIDTTGIWAVLNDQRLEVVRPITFKTSTIVEWTGTLEHLVLPAGQDAVLELEIRTQANVVKAIVSRTVQGPGSYQLALGEIPAGQYKCICRLLTTGAVQVRWTEQAWRSIPPQWLWEPAVGFDVSDKRFSDAALEFDLTNQKLTFQGGTASVFMQHLLPADRQLCFSFIAPTAQDVEIEFCLADQHGAVLATIMRLNLLETRYKTFQRYYAVLPKVNTESGSWRLLMRFRGTLLQPLELESPRWYFIPLPYQMNLIANGDFSFQQSRVDVKRLTPDPLLAVADAGQLVVDNGYVGAQVFDRQGFSFQFKGPSLQKSEVAKITVEGADAAAVMPEAINFSTDVAFDSQAVAFKLLDTGLWLDFNPNVSRRQLHPFTDKYLAEPTGAGLYHSLQVVLTPRFYSFGNDIPTAFKVYYNQVRIQVEYDHWNIDPYVGKRSLYNAYLLQPGQVLTDPLNSLQHWQRRAALFTLDTEYSTEFSQARFRIAYTPKEDIQSQFTRYSQLTRFSVQAVELMLADPLLIEALPVGETIEETDLPMMVASCPFDGAPWVNIASPAAKNVYGATVLYAGPLRVFDAVPVDGSANSVLELRLNPDYSTFYKGVVRLYYTYLGSRT